MIDESSQLRPQILRELTYLQLCTIPSTITPYLRSLNQQQLKHALFLHTQTFLQKFPLHSRHTHSQEEFHVFLKECHSTPLGKQMLYLLHRIISHCLTVVEGIGKFFLDLDHNADVAFVKIQQILLEDIASESKDPKDHNLLSCLKLSLNFSWELLEIKRGNAKHLQLSMKEEMVESEEKAYDQRTSQLNDINQTLEKMSTDHRPISVLLLPYTQRLIRKYSYVVLQRYKKESMKASESGSTPRKIAQEPIEAIPAPSAAETNTYLQYPRTTNEKSHMVTQIYLNSVRQFEKLTIRHLESLSQSITEWMSQLWEHMGSGDASLRTNAYLLRLGVRVMIAVKQQPTYDWNTFLDQLEPQLKQIMDVSVCSIRVTWLFLCTLLRLPLKHDTLSSKLKGLIHWVMQLYSTQKLTSDQFIYADCVILVKEVISVFDKNEGDRKRLLSQLAGKLKKYGERQFCLFFEIIPKRYLEQICQIYLALRTPLAVQLRNQLKKTDQTNVLSLFADSIDKAIDTFCFKGYIPVQKDKIEEQERLMTMLNVWVQRTSGKKKMGLELLLLIAWLVKETRSEISTDTMQKRLKLSFQICLEKMKFKSQTLLSSCVGKKNDPESINEKNTGQEEPQSNKEGQTTFKHLYSIGTMLSCLLFSFDPSKNHSFILHALLLNNYFEEVIPNSCLFELYHSLLPASAPQPAELLSYEPLLSLATRYDLLQGFFIECLKPRCESSAEWIKIRADFESFCRQWCRKDRHYQWWSEQNMLRINFLEFKEYCVVLKQHLSE